MVTGAPSPSSSETAVVRADITSRGEVERLVDAFYARVRADGVLAPIFDDVAHVDWNQHLPKMYDFWTTVLFGQAAYSGNPLAVHRELAGRVPLGEPEFERWLEVFRATVDTLFSGPGADHVKVRAARIAAVMQHHISRDQAMRR
ncbi:MAG: group III truncated hemoglobin [Acidobacteriota bacterium]